MSKQIVKKPKIEGIPILFKWYNDQLLLSKKTTIIKTAVKRFKNNDIVQINKNQFLAFSTSRPELKHHVFLMDSVLNSSCTCEYMATETENNAYRLKNVCSHILASKLLQKVNALGIKRH